MVRWRQYQSTVLIYAILLLVLSGMVVPLVWTLLTSFKYNVDVTLGWIPPRWTTDNYVGVFHAFSFLRYYANSLVIATAVTVVQVATSALAAYAFARLQFRGRDVLFLGYLSTMMIPADVLLIPQFVLMKKIPEFLNAVLSTDFFSGFLYLGSHYIGHPVGLDSFFALIVPGCFSAYGTFMLRQFLLGISREIEEAALIDGCSAWGVFWHVVVPLSKPALGALAIFTFLGRWRAFLWPLIMTDSDSMMVLPVGLAKLSDLYVNDYGLICAGSVVDAFADDRGFRLFSAVVYQRDSARGGEGVTEDRLCITRISLGHHEPCFYTPAPLGIRILIPQDRVENLSRLYGETQIAQVADGRIDVPKKLFFDGGCRRVVANGTIVINQNPLRLCALQH